MEMVALHLEDELRGLDPIVASQFREVVRGMLKLLKRQSDPQSSLHFGYRIADDPAIGTWPKTVDADAHIQNLRSEW